MTKPISEYLTFRGGKWVTQLFVETNDITKFNDVKFFYANIIDYIRIIMTLIAAYTITTDWHLLSAYLILGATYLDTIDGRVAHAYDQCSIFGCGIDWLADLLFGTGIFDFGITTTRKYPILNKNQTGFFIILDWSIPLNTYTKFGSFIWYVYYLYCILCILEYCYGYNKLISIINLFSIIQEQNLILILFLLNRYCLFISSLCHIWCELAYGIRMIQSWIEPTRKQEPAINEIIYEDVSKSYQGGFIHYKSVSNEYKNLIETSISKREVFWINLWKRTGNQIKQITYKNYYEIDKMVHILMEKYYHTNTVILDGYGYLLNPINSQRQAFHIDYNCDYSSLFIPLVPILADNSVQYINPSPFIDSDLFHEATKNYDKINVNLLLQNENYYTVRQCISNPFTVLKMDFRTIRRGISNQDTYHRLMFYISVIRKNSPNQTSIPDEQLIETIKKDL
ncbi:unnamed protein product [Rotaria sordida]|uniref:CDP-alcohol phosphatidyltransferase n=1 Tax=Rotaria sordida TaxID=392033 RepID=A0A816AIX1_9BILA|nr:unnamed protein product [Rotaria sordida]CAF1596518.1 unnamed protein product [Rotaria sordida]